MRRSFELRDFVDDPTIVDRLRAFLERKNRPAIDMGDIVPADQIPDELARFAVGMTYGRHHETILRCEVRRQQIPTWFDPREHPGQFGYISPSSGLRVYVQTDINHASRSAPSVFDEKIMSLVEVNPEALSLF